MSVAVQSVGTLQHATTSPLTHSFTVGSGTNVVAVVVVGVAGSSTSGSFSVSVTLGGTSMTSCGALKQGQVGATSKGVQAFYLANPTTGTPSVVVTASQSGGTISDVYSNVVVLSGAHQATPVRPGSFVSSAATTGTSSSQSITSSVNDITIGLTGSQQEATTPTTNQTLDGSNAGSAMDFAHDHGTTPAATITDNWTYSSSGAGFVLAGFSIQPQLVDDSNEGWWAGIQKCGAVVAVAAGLALSAGLTAQASVQYFQDELAGPPPVALDHEYWQNPVPPVPLTLGKLYLPDPEELPAGFLFGQPDEDYWFTTPILRTTSVSLNFAEIGSAASLQEDEDYWQNPTPPVTAKNIWPQPYVFEQDDPGIFYGLPEEYYWANPTVPVPASVAWVQQWPYEQNEYVAPLPPSFVFEEDWNNPVAPVPATNLWSSPWQFEQDDPGNLFGQPDEDYWQNSVAPAAASVYQRLPLGDPEEIPAGSLHGQPDEDYWVNSAAPVVATNLWPNQWLFEQNESPTLFGVPEEYFWNPPLPAKTWLGVSLQFSEQGSASQLTVDEIYWQNPTPAVPASNLYPQQWVFEQDEQASGLVGAFDEDYWINPVAPVQASLYLHLPLGDPEEIATKHLHGLPDEDYWVNSTPPVVATNLWLQQWNFEQNESPNLFGQPDEDYWVNSVVPVASVNQWPSPWAFEQNEIVVRQLDEDYWSNPASLVKTQSITLFFPEQGSASVTTVDEVYWINPVAPVAATNVWPLPWKFEQNEQAFGLFGTYDEDYWTNPVPSVLASLRYLGPWQFEQNESGIFGSPLDEDYWLFLNSNVSLNNFLPRFQDDGNFVPVRVALPTSLVIWSSDDFG